MCSNLVFKPAVGGGDGRRKRDGLQKNAAPVIG